MKSRDRSAGNRNEQNRSKRAELRQMAEALGLGSADAETIKTKRQIAADKYLASKNAMARKGLGLTRVKIIPPGTV